jgi:hypothetical protein
LNNKKIVKTAVFFYLIKYNTFRKTKMAKQLF